MTPSALARGQDLFMPSKAFKTIRHFEYHHRNPGLFDPSHLVGEGAEAVGASARFRHASRLLRATRMGGLRAPGGPLLDPVAFGADPTGEDSSSDALEKAVQAMVGLARDDRKDFLGLFDLGGATLDLSGGIYLIDRPLKVPAKYSNFRIQRGTLIASPSFAKNQYMLTVGGGCSHEPKDGGCNRNVDISHMTIDGQSRAFGGIIVNHTMDINIGPAMYITSWTDVGISLEGSGAGQIHQAFLGEIPPNSPISRKDANGTAILLASGQHDAQVSDVIIFSGRKGIVSVNGANQFQGVHAWNLAGAAGGVGIELGNPWGGPSGGLVQNCYLDFAPLVISDPGNCLVTGNLFLGWSNLVLRATKKNFEVRNLVVTSNTQHGKGAKNASMVLDERLGNFGALVDTLIENNEVVSSEQKRGSRATKSVTINAGKAHAVMYFDKDLLFDVPIEEASVRCWLYGTHATAIVGEVKFKHAVKVTLAEPVPAGGKATATCTVDQSKRAWPAH